MEKWNTKLSSHYVSQHGIFSALLFGGGMDNPDACLTKSS
jgi:hypothetical protein